MFNLIPRSIFVPFVVVSCNTPTLCLSIWEPGNEVLPSCGLTGCELTCASFLFLMWFKNISTLGNQFANKIISGEGNGKIVAKGMKYVSMLDAEGTLLNGSSDRCCLLFWYLLLCNKQSEHTLILISVLRSRYFFSHLFIHFLYSGQKEDF